MKSEPRPATPARRERSEPRTLAALLADREALVRRMILAELLDEPAWRRMGWRGHRAGGGRHG